MSGPPPTTIVADPFPPLPSSRTLEVKVPLEGRGRVLRYNVVALLPTTAPPKGEYSRAPEKEFNKGEALGQG